MPILSRTSHPDPHRSSRPRAPWVAAGLAALATASMACGAALGGVQVAELAEPGVAGEGGAAVAAEAWLPAGLYFRDGHYELSACLDCVEPDWAVALGPFADGQGATRAMSAVDAAALPPGYPWAVLAAELAVEEPVGDGILLVLGLFAEEASARAVAGERPGARVLTLSSREDALRRHRARDHEGPRETLVQIDAGPAAPAYELEGVQAALHPLQRHGTFEDYDDFLRQRDAATARLVSVCEVPAGSVHLSEGGRDAVSVQDHFAPVTCPDGRRAFVEWGRTRVLSVVRPTGAGEYRILQSILIECDVPMFESWAYTRDGRRPDPGDPILVEASAGCGG